MLAYRQYFQPTISQKAASRQNAVAEALWPIEENPDVSEWAVALLQPLTVANLLVQTLRLARR